MANPHIITLPGNDTFMAVIDLDTQSELLKAIARSNGVRYSSKTQCATAATEHLLPITEPYTTYKYEMMAHLR